MLLICRWMRFFLQALHVFPLFAIVIRRRLISFLQTLLHLLRCFMFSERLTGFMSHAWTSCLRPPPAIRPRTMTAGAAVNANVKLSSSSVCGALFAFAFLDLQRVERGLFWRDIVFIHSELLNYHSISQCVVLGRFARASFSFAYPFFLFFFFAILLPLALFVPPVSFPFPHLSFYRSTSLSLYLSIFMALASVTHLASAVTDRSSNEPRRLLFQSVTWQCKFEGFGNGLLQEHRCHFGYL